MTTLTEGDLRLCFPDAVNGRKFDGDEHGLSHCMKAVDFIVEFDDRYLFIEVKDPENPGATLGDRKKFTQRLQIGKLDEDLKYKFRDSVLYEQACGRADKPVHYYVLIALDRLTPLDLDARTDTLKRQLPLLGPGSKPWPRPFVSGCAVFNVDSWNRNFPKYPVARLSG